MRKFIKHNLLELCGSVLEMHNVILKEKNIENRIEFLLLCQESVVAIGDTAALHIADMKSIDAILSEYCDNLLPIAQMQEISEGELDKLSSLVNDVIGIITAQEVTYEIVFFPYSASMWDSMESVYNAFMEKPNYKCIVVPIPYRTFDKQTGQWNDCYDGNDFPKNIDITHYSEYSLEKNVPEVAFIHNPYDEYNSVTRVYEEYYSKAIKQYVGKLVYLPYYVTTGEFEESHLRLSAYINADYIVVQSKYIKEQFLQTPIYNKVVSLGSPKLDCIIKRCETGGEIPLEWQDILKNKKALMLNTTLGSVINNKEQLLNKLRVVFEKIKNHSEIVLIWRPHPLLLATIDSMLPELREKYDELIKYFTDEKIGILDTTADIANTIAISDGYIGDGGSSVLNLFGIANKPVFILNYHSRCYTKEDSDKILFNRLEKHGADYYTTVVDLPGIYKVNADLCSASIAAYRKENYTASLYNFIVSHDDKIYLSPLMAQDFLRYNIEKNKFENFLKLDTPVRCMKVLRYKDKIIYLPQQNSKIIVYDTKKNVITHQEFKVSSLSENGKTYYDDSYGFQQVGKDVYITSNHSNIITCFDAEAETQTLLAVGPRTQGYIDICFDGRYFWLAGVYDSEVVRYDKKSGERISYKMPEGFKSHQSCYNRTLPHTGVFCYKNNVYTIPAYSNSMVKINKDSTEAELFMPELFEKHIGKDGYIENKAFATAVLVYQNENNIILQSSIDGEILNIDLEKETVKKSYVRLLPKDLVEIENSLLDKSSGFFRKDFKETFCKRESRMFTLEKFLKDISEDNLQGIKELQKRSLAEIAENLDGTAGQKICNFICKSI